MSKTISGLPLAETLTGDELLPVVQDGNTVQSTIQQVADLVGNTTTWGDIQGTLSNQTDLQNALNLKVPYTGATGNVNLGEYGLTSGYFQADLTPTNALQVGRMQWNDQDGTMDLRLKGDNVTLQIGQEQLIRVVNKTGATLTETDYQCVKISGAQGQRPKVDLAQANNDANSADTVGLVTETISNNQEGFVTTSGLVRNINTTGSMQGETWADGDVLYLSGTTAGRLTNIKPQAPIHTVIVGFVIYAHNNQGKIFVKVDNGYELDELHNVRINGVTDGQVLAYDSTLSVWENINQSAITSGNSDKVDGYHVQVDGTGTDPNTIYFKTTGGVDPSAAVWGDITGSIVDQTDLYNALVNGTYATGNWNINAASVDGYSVQVDGTGTDPNTIYFKTTGGTISVDWDDVSNTPTTVAGYGITDVFTETESDARFLGISATAVNSDKVDGYHVQVDGTGTDPNTIYFKTTGGTTSVAWGNISGTLSAQTDLQTALDGKYSTSNPSGYITASALTPYAPINNPTFTGTVSGITKAMVGLGNVDNTADAVKSVSYATSSGNADTVDGYNVQVDGTGTNPNTIYFKTTGGSISVEWDDVSNTPTTIVGYGITDAVTTSGDQTVGGTKTFSSTITGSITGNAGTVTNGVYTSGDQTIGGTKTFSSTISGSIDGNSNTVDGYHVQVDGTGTDPNTIYFKTTGGSIGVDWDDISNTPTTVAGYGITDAVTTSGDQTIGGTKTFSSTITGSITGNAGTVTNGVYTTGTQTITGNKTFTGSVTMGQSGGVEGGEILWYDPVQGTVVTDIPVSGVFRVFQASGTARGAYIDLANCAGGVGSLLLHSTNYNSFAPTLTGTGASGSWGISVTGNAGTVTNGVYTTGDQTIGGNKTFTGTTSITNGPLVLPTASGTNSFISGTGDGASLSTYNFALSGWNGMAFYNPTVGGVYPTSTTGVVNFRDGIIEMRGSLRAPIFYDSADTSYYLDPANAGTSMVVAGNVGIGTTSPTFRLVSANSSTDGGWLYSTGAVSILGLGGYSGATDGAFSLRYDRSNGNITFNGGNRDTPTERMRIDGSGNVGIGNNNPTFKLDVNGSFRVANDGGGGVGGLWTMRNTASGATNPDKNFRVGATGSLEIINNAYNSIPFTLTDSGTLFAGEAVQAPIYYDVNNTAFYVNPNGTSNISALVMNGLLTGRSSASTNVNTANDTGSFSVRGSSTTVASMSFHRTGTYAINMGLGTDNVFRIGGWSASSNCLQMDGSGNLTMLNNVTAYSDARLKTDVVKIENALDKVQQLNGYTYTRTDTGSKQTGVIAQEVMKVLPEVVMGSEDTHYSVAYGNMVGLLIEAIKEQQGQINELKLTIEQLKGN